MPFREFVRIHAPEFPKDLDWINSGPLNLTKLRGRIVLIDFWTSCCINCIHVIPELSALEEKYKLELQVLGVHAGKFPAEHTTEHIRHAVEKYGIMHPVVNDRHFQVWDEYVIRAWPSFRLIDPEGMIVGGHSGERIFEMFDQAVQVLIRKYGANLKKHPVLCLNNRKPNRNLSGLYYPGDVKVSQKYLVVADSGNHRILLNPAGSNRFIAIGTGEPGLKDGSFQKCCFQQPRGLCLSEKGIFVADTGNHCIRFVDVESQIVTTLAGTGIQSTKYQVRGTKNQTNLNSPWNLVSLDGQLFVSMAGSHQIATISINGGPIQTHAGTGREDCIDGSLQFACFAQPTGIATDGKSVYVIDSESSAVRRLDNDLSNRVETLIGQGLFDFGDIDGDCKKAALQHPTGIAIHDGNLYISDTFNNKIKELDLERCVVKTIIGTGNPGKGDGPGKNAEIYEPAGICVFNSKLYIADANNHRICVYEIASKELSTINIEIEI